MTLIQIIRTFKRGLALALALVVKEKLAWIVEPTLFGQPPQIRRDSNEPHLNITALYPQPHCGDEPAIMPLKMA